MANPIFSIGHSNHSLERFFDLLRAHSIEVVADVRSRPYARYTTHFHGPLIKAELIKAGFKYVWLGKEIGGMPESKTLYDEDGHVDYTKVAATPAFAEGFNRLLGGIDKFTVALMCGEENPVGCHRRNLIAAQLAKREIIVQHIRADGRLETEDDYVVVEPPKVEQLGLFG